MNSAPFLEIGRKAPVIRLRTKTPLKLGKAGRPPEWRDADMTKKQVISVRLNFFKCPIVKRRLEEAGLPAPQERFKVPVWGERVSGTPLIRHKETGELYLWCLGEGIESCEIFAGDKDITSDPRLPILMGRNPADGAPTGLMSFCLRLDSILEIL